MTCKIPPMGVSTWTPEQFEAITGQPAPTGRRRFTTTVWAGSRVLSLSDDGLPSKEVVAWLGRVAEAWGGRLELPPEMWGRQ